MILLTEKGKVKWRIITWVKLGDYMSEKKNLKTNVIEFPSLTTKVRSKEKRKINCGLYATGKNCGEKNSKKNSA